MYSDENSPDPLRSMRNRDLDELLDQVGVDINGLDGPNLDGRTETEEQTYDVLPLRSGWLRLGLDDRERPLGGWITDPADPTSLVGREFALESEHDELAGFISARADIDGAARRLLSVHRPPDREAYVALIHDRRESVHFTGVLTGIYPDVVLAGSHVDRVAMVRPDATDPARTEAVVAPVSDTSCPEHVVARGDAAELRLTSMGDRRFVAVEHGPRTDRRTLLVDVDHDVPRLTPVMWPVGASCVTVAGECPPTVYAAAHEHGGWALRRMSVRGPGSSLIARGPGIPMRLVASGQTLVLHVADPESGVERVLWLPSSCERAMRPSKGYEVLRSDGSLRLGAQPMPSDIGWTAVDINAAGPQVNYFGRRGQLLGSTQRGEDMRTTFLREMVRSEDGFQFTVEARWPGSEEAFSGPVLFLLYGAYGIDVHVDADPELSLWLEEGFAVVTAHIRGGARVRHAAGSRGNRHRSVADARAALHWLRHGATRIHPTSITVLGASAGGFLASLLIATEPREIDTGIIVNGYIDPLRSLQAGTSLTAAADRAEWGDPRDPAERRVLEALSPLSALERMECAPASAPRVLLVVAGKDVRVDPRQSVEFCVRYRRLGHEATLWHDPDGTHDRWGVDLSPRALPRWAADQLHAS